MFNVTKVIGIVGFFLVLVIGCGGEEKQYVESFEYDVANNMANLGVEFSSDVSLNTDLTVPVLDYGFVSLIANDDQYGFRIKTDLDLAALVDPAIVSLSKTRNLPNGQSMSSYIESDVAQLRIEASKKITANIYFGLEPEQTYVGVGLELGFIDEDFPAGLVMSQRMRDDQGRMLGVVTIYGPELEDGEIVTSGGIFFMSNVSDLLSYLNGQQNLSNLMIKASLAPVERTFVNQIRFENINNLHSLLKLYKKKGKRAGFID